MNSADIFILLFVFFIIKIFFDILIPDKKKKRNYRKKTTKMTENQKFITLGSIFAIGIVIYIINILIDTIKFVSISIIEILIILSIIGIFIFTINFLTKMFFPNIHNKIKNIFNRQEQTTNYNDDFHHYEYQNKNYKTYETPKTKKPHNTTKVEPIEDKYKETKKLNEMLENIKIKNISKTQQNMYNTIKKTKPKKSTYKLGEEYEKQIGKYYEDLGYKINYHGIEKKKKDNGIDLIATNNDETIFIQCKNNQNSTIHQIKLKEFIGNCTEFIEKNPNKYQNIKRIFIVAKDNTNYGTKKYIENNKSMEYKVIPYLDI